MCRDNENDKDPVSVPAPTLNNGSGNNRRIGILNNNAVFSLVVGSCYMILIEFC